MAATIGRSAEDGAYVEIGDTARRSGLYILGGPGMGKTQLLINLILSDIRSGHGVFFLDPHGDAIDQVLERLPTTRRQSDIILLNPADKTHTFGINLLRCDPADIGERNEAYARAYGIFERLWRDEMGPWLQLILSNTLPVFIENQGCTLADIPLFLQNKEFRNIFLNNVRHNTQPLDFWKNAFSASRNMDQQAKVDAALTRLYILLTKEYVRHVICQPESTLDFATAMREKKVILLELPAHLPEDDKRFLGAIVISELLHVTRSRQMVTQSERSQFCIFVDEFQNFATSRDFGTLITEGRKFGIATTIAHQERFGQLSDDKKIQGATAVVANKVIFQTTVNDARELAPEFAKDPPFEIRKERELVVSQSPVAGLLAGHANPEIRQFVDAYLRHLDDKRVDAKEEVERARILREGIRDGIQSDKLTAQLERVNRLGGRGASPLSRAIGGADEAQSLTIQMLDLFDTASSLRLTIREFDRFFAAIMEGRVNPDGDDEEFSSFLIARSRLASQVPAEHRPVLETYISLSFGNPAVPRAIPFDLAQAYRLEHEQVKRLEAEANATALHERQQLYERLKNEEWSLFAGCREREKELMLEEVRRLAADDDNRFLHRELWPPPRKVPDFEHPLRHLFQANIRWRASISRDNCAFRDSIASGNRAVEASGVGLFPSIKVQFGKGLPKIGTTVHARFNTTVLEDARRIYCYVAWLESIPGLRTCLAPYLTARFNDQWRSTIAQTDGLITQLCEPYKASEKLADLFDEFRYLKFMKPAFADRVENFLREYKEGAFVVLAMLQGAECTFFWSRITEKNRNVYNRINSGYYEPNAARIPGLRDKDPVETFRVVTAAAEAMQGVEWIDRDKGTYKQVLQCFRLAKGYDNYTADYLEKISKAGLRINCSPTITNLSRRDDVKFVKKLVAEKWKWFTYLDLKRLDIARLWLGGEYESEARTWREIDDLARCYVAGRACDIIGFGQDVADISFPRPSFCGGEQLVQALAAQIVKYEKELIRKDDEEKEAQAREKIEAECERRVAKVGVRLPVALTKKRLTSNERQEIVAACEKYLESKGMGGAIAVIERFVWFCRALKLPENHVLGPSGQYIEKKVQTRTVTDMNSEMAQELAALPRFTAYAKVHQEREGAQQVIKVKISTLYDQEDHSLIPFMPLTR